MILFSFSEDNKWVPGSTTVILKGSSNAPKRLKLHDVANDGKEGNYIKSKIAIACPFQYIAILSEESILTWIRRFLKTEYVEC